MSEVLEADTERTKRKKWPKDIIGLRFGKLVVLRQSQEDYILSSGRRSRKFLCLCDCGNEVSTTRNRLICGDIKSCGCLTNWRGFREISGTYWHRLIAGAKRRNIPFEITIDYIWELFLTQNRRCALSGRELRFVTHLLKEGLKSLRNQNASLDRIDSSLGYIKGNVQWIDKEFSDMKMNRKEERFFELCKEVVNYQTSKANKDDGSIPQI